VNRSPIIGTLVLAGLVIALSFLFLPLFIALLVVIVVAIAIVLMDARKNRILLTMATRNIIRRKWTTALILGGLMVGTAIISTSLVVGDTMDNMIVKQATVSLGEVDFGIGEVSSGYRYFNDNNISGLAGQFASIQHVEASSALLRDTVAIKDNVSGLSNPSFTLIGLNSTLVKNFGYFYDLEGNLLPDAPGANEIYLNERAVKDIDAHQGDLVFLFKGQHQVIVVTVAKIVQDKGLGAFGSTNLVIMNITTAQVFTQHIGQSNFIFVSLSGVGDSGLAYADQVRAEIITILDTQAISPELKIQSDKAEVIKDSKDTSQMFSSMFFVFGSFSIIAGVVLVVNIFTMLGEERKGENGVARAIGMRRSQLRRLMTYEGTIFAALAAAIGSVLGLALAYLIVWAMSGIIKFEDFSFNLVDYFTFTPISLVLGYLAGFSLTLLTVYLTTRRISLLNIVRAIRSIPEPPVLRSDKRPFRIGLLALIGGAILLVMGISFENLAFASSGLSFMTLSIGLLLRRIISERLAWNLAGILTLLVWMPLPYGLKIFPYKSEIEGFVIAGLFIVVAALLIVMFNSDSLIHIITKVFRVRKEYRAVLKTSISYPLKAKFRTALSIFIFGLVIFTMTTLTVVAGLMSVNIDRMVSETSGGFDVIAYTSPSTPIMDDPWQQLNQTGSPLQGGNVTHLIPLPVSMASINVTTLDLNQQPVYSTVLYQLMGFNTSFYTQGNYPLADYNHSLYASEIDVWHAVQANSSLAIADGSVAPQSGFGGGMGPPGSQAGLQVAVGETLRMKSPFNVEYNVTIIGIMKQSAFQGIFMREQTVKSEFGAIGFSVLLVQFRGDLDSSTQSILLEKTFLANGLQTLDIQALARMITSLINSMLSLFEAFLGMGLIIGISGLAIITIRSIHERKLEIGMMRAIGYRKSMVVANFAIESGFISLLGIILGSVLGIVVGYQLWQTSLEPNGFIWTLDLWPIFMVGTLSFAATLLSVYPAARGASKVAPADVLRFE
jgi:putative ABC transport system permease protein